MEHPLIDCKLISAHRSHRLRWPTCHKLKLSVIMVRPLTEPMEFSFFHPPNDSDSAIESPRSSCYYSTAEQSTPSNGRDQTKYKIVLGKLLVDGLETEFREYFAPNFQRTAEGTTNVREFVQRLKRTRWLDVLSEDGEKDVARLDGALESLDTFRTEVSHYTWEDFLDRLGSALGGGAVYKGGVGFVVPQEDGRALSTQDMFRQATKELDEIHACGGTRDGFRERLSKVIPEEYGASPSAGGIPRRKRGEISAGGPDTPMEIEDSVDACARGTTSAPLEVLDDSDEEEQKKPPGKEEGQGKGEWVDKIDRSIAEMEKMIMEEEKARRCRREQARDRPEASNVEPPAAGGEPLSGDLSVSLGASFKSALQLSDDVEERIEAKERWQKRAKMDDYLRKGQLSPEQEREVDQALDGGPLGEVLVNAFNTKLTRKDLICLNPLAWLNDEVVNMYMLLLGERDKELCKKDPSRRRSHFFSSFFYTKLSGNGKYDYTGVRRWTRKIKVFELDKIFCPVNVSNIHWCMAIIYVQQKRIHYYDSMGGVGRSVTNSLLMWLEDEDEDKNGNNATFEPDDWTLAGTDTTTTPQQENGSDCGMFSCAFASYASDDLAFDFSQPDITQMRRRMLWSLLHKRLV